MLCSSAEKKAKELVEESVFDHYTEKHPDSIVWAFDDDWSIIGENLAMGYLSPYDVAEAWHNSPDHKEIMLADYSDICIYKTNYKKDKGEKPLWIMHVGRK